MHLFKKQLEKPQGYIGGLIGWMMDQNNEERSKYTLSKLQVGPHDQLLEVGFGSGRTLAKVQQLLADGGKVVGVDHSEIMYQKAIQLNRVAIAQGKVELYCKCLWDFNTLEEHYDTVYASNVHEFWQNPITEFRFMRELLRVGGKLVIVFQLQGLKSLAIEQAIEQAKAQFMAAGFDRIESDYQKLKTATCISVIGYK